MNIERIEALLEVVHRAEVGEVRVEGEGWQIAVRKGRAGRRARAPVHPLPVEESLAGPPAHTVSATRVGRFRSSEPALAPGDRVEEGQILGSIETMGILSPVFSPEGGAIAAVLVADGQAVQYGQELFTLAPGGPEPPRLAAEVASS